jgi:hypothetical protein
MRSLLRVGIVAACFSLIPLCAVADSDRGRKGEPHGSAFKLFGNAQMTTDPENRENIVLRVITEGAPDFPAAGAYRDLRHVKLWHLDHQLSFKRAFVAPNTCDGGSPRIQLFIDANGDGKFQQAPQGPDFVAHGHVRPPFAGCETSMPTPVDDRPSPSTLLWRFEDLTDEQFRWEVTPGGIAGIGPIGSAGAVNWDGLEAAISSAFPKHQVLRAMLVEDFTATPGTAYYDLITVLELTLGTKGQEKAPNPGRGRDRDDDEDDD